VVHYDGKETFFNINKVLDALLKVVKICKEFRHRADESKTRVIRRVISDNPPLPPPAGDRTV